MAGQLPELSHFLAAALAALANAGDNRESNTPRP